MAESDPQSPAAKLRELVLGKPKELKDPTIFHRMALIAILAWVGLGADGLSSSSYGPEDAYKALGSHTHIAVLLALATTITVFVISWSYSRIIEAFPSGGGGYTVAFKLLGPMAGVVSGSALLVDYVLTIAISIAAGADAILSVPVLHWMLPVKFVVCLVAILLLTLMNLRGVKESVTVLAPIFILFLVTHALVIGLGIAQNAGNAPQVVSEVHQGFATDLQTMGALGLAILFFKAYSLGGGTYTGIEAVANGMKIMREPVIHTAKRTMVYMAFSLAITASGILVCYLLTDARYTPGVTMNAVLIDRVIGHWTPGGVRIGEAIASITLFTEAALLFVAAQAGFIDGPRVMAAMAVDSWLPHRFAALSDRLTMRNGIWLMTAAALLAIWATGAKVDKLIVLYSINVFLTFTMSNISMATRAVRLRAQMKNWAGNLAIHVLAIALCGTILAVFIVVKFSEGAWKTLLITGVLVGACVLVRRHYAQVRFRLRRLEVALADLPPSEKEPAPIDALQPTAVLLVGNFGGLGVHSLLSIFRFFPGYFKNVVFVSIGVIDSGNFKGTEELEALRESTQRGVNRYIELARKLGIAATGVVRVGTDAVDEAEKVCDELSEKYPRHMFFGGKLVFRRESWYERLLHNETAFAIQRRLQWKGHPMTVLPVRVLE